MTKSSDSGFIRLQRDRAPERDDGIEDGAGGVGKRRDLLHRRGTGQGPAAADELEAIGFAGDLTLRRRPGPP